MKIKKVNMSKFSSNWHSQCIFTRSLDKGWAFNWCSLICMLNSNFLTLQEKKYYQDRYSLRQEIQSSETIERNFPEKKCCHWWLHNYFFKGIWQLIWDEWPPPINITRWPSRTSASPSRSRSCATTKPTVRPSRQTTCCSPSSLSLYSSITSGYSTRLKWIMCQTR